MSDTATKADIITTGCVSITLCWLLLCLTQQPKLTSSRLAVSVYHCAGHCYVWQSNQSWHLHDWLCRYNTVLVTVMSDTATKADIITTGCVSITLCWSLLCLTQQPKLSSMCVEQSGDNSHMKVNGNVLQHHITVWSISRQLHSLESWLVCYQHSSPCAHYVFLCCWVSWVL